MNHSIALSRAIAFLIDNVLIYLVANLISTVLNPYASSAQNHTYALILYIATLLVYITVAEYAFDTTPEKKLMNIR